MYTVKKQGAVDIIHTETALDSNSAESFGDFTHQMIQAGQQRIVFDMSEVPLIDSAGMEAILNLQDECQRRGGALRIAAPTNLCQDILDVCEISRSVEVLGDVTRAVGRFAL